jgi:hypothetical protein
MYSRTDLKMVKFIPSDKASAPKSTISTTYLPRKSTNSVFIGILLMGYFNIQENREHSLHPPIDIDNLDH